LAGVPDLSKNNFARRVEHNSGQSRRQLRTSQAWHLGPPTPVWEAVRLRAEGLAYREIGERLGVNPAAMAAQLRRAAQRTVQVEDRRGAKPVASP
jgi:DNA-directed RNA polymerase specialized sigma24 family protein